MFARFHLCEHFAMVVSDVGVTVRIANHGHGNTRRGVFRFWRLASDSGQDAASAIEARVEFAARVVADHGKLIVIAVVRRPSDYDLVVLDCYRSGLAIANVGRDLAVIAETLVKTPISVIAQTRKVIDPATVVDGIPSNQNFPILLHCRSRRVTAANANSS